MNIPISKCSNEFKELIVNLITSGIVFDIEYEECKNLKFINLVFSRKLKNKEEILKSKFVSNSKDNYYEYSYDDNEYKIIDTDVDSIKKWLEHQDYFTIKKLENIQ